MNLLNRIQLLIDHIDDPSEINRARLAKRYQDIREQVLALTNHAHTQSLYGALANEETAKLLTTPVRVATDSRHSARTDDHDDGILERLRFGTSG